MMYNAVEITYTPRQDKDVIEELKTNGKLPIELQEQLQLVEMAPESIRQKIDEIIERIFKTNKLETQIPRPVIQISGHISVNASMITAAKHPILIINKGLLSSVQSEDELAGVIAHELGHLLLHEHHKEADHHNKVEESMADIRGVDLLRTAGYDPQGVIYFLKSMGGDEGHLINLESVTDAGSLQKAADSLKELADPHPSDASRIRTMESYITSLERNAASTNKPQITQLDSGFKDSANLINYESPITKGLNKVAYDTLPVTEKLKVLTCLLNDIYPPTNRTSAERLGEIAEKIGVLTVNLTNTAEAEAFQCLSDITMGEFKGYEGRLVFPRKCQIGQNISVQIDAALNNVWQRGSKDPNYLSRNEDLKKALQLFTDATTKDDAEKHATDISALCDRIIHYYNRSINFNGFYPPNFADIDASIQATGTWLPPYSKHVQWCREKQSENIKKILLMMHLSEDPWAEKILGSCISLRMSIDSPMRRFDKPNWAFGNHKLLNFLYKRNDEGCVTGRIVEVAPYQWQHSPSYSSLETLIKDHHIQGECKSKYEEIIIRDIDWNCLKTDFSLFIFQYGQLINGHSTIKPVPTPFAERFFRELIQLLPTADEDFKSRLKDFFRHYKADDHIPSHPATLQHFMNLYPKDSSWRYSQVTQPTYWNLDAPFIQFLLNPKSSTIMSDENKLYYLRMTSGFIKPDVTKKLADIFNTPLHAILEHYPQNINTITDLKVAAEGDYPTYARITIALEAERLAYTFADTMTMDEYLILEYNLRDFFSDTVYVSNIKASLDQLRHKTVQRYLSTNDCLELINIYRTAVAHFLLRDAPFIRNESLSKIKGLILGLSEETKLECLKALFKPETFAPPYRYDGYIADPAFRHWAIEELTDTLAIKLGEDVGASEYIAQAKSLINDISQNTAGITQLNILSRLATKINAQKELAYFIRDTYNNYATTDALARRIEAIAGELSMNECSTDPTLRTHICDYLSAPLTEESPNTLRRYLQIKYNAKYGKESDIFIDDQLRNYHKNFRAAALEMRTVYLEFILFPLNSTPDAQLQVIKDLISKVFPTKSGVARPGHAVDNNEYAHLMTTAYLNAAQEMPERRLLATALFIANMHEEQAVERTIGQKLNMVLSNMGPAGGKLLQAIHSHPQTPEDIKQDLASSKTMFDPPLRWELIELVEKSGLLDASPEEPLSIKNIGKLVGAGSFGLTVFNTLTDDTKVADTFLRGNAAKKAAREFSMMRTAASKIVSSCPELKPIIFMVDEATRSAVDETNMALAVKANVLAEHSYDNIQVHIDEYCFIHKVTNLQKTGDNFKRVTIAPGEHFNDLINSPKKQAIAKAMVITQISLRLAGFNTDLDRHGGNIKIQGNTITHFDFGAMNTTPLTTEDKTITGKILAEVVIAVSEGKDFTKALLNHIQNATVSDASRIYLNGLNKDFLALGDYIHIIKTGALANLLAKCLIAKTVDPEIRAAFSARLGFLYGILIQNVLTYKTQHVSDQVFLRPTKENESQMLLIRAEYAIRFTHMTDLGLVNLTDEEISEKNKQVTPLIKQIDRLKKYGEKLKTEGKQGGQLVINLALNLRSEVCSFLDGKILKQEATPRIDALMQQGMPMMRDHRRVQDILGHILLAFTGIGIILMIKQKVERGTFFLNKTKRESLLSDVDEEIKKIPLKS